MRIQTQRRAYINGSPILETIKWVSQDQIATPMEDVAVKVKGQEGLWGWESAVNQLFEPADDAVDFPKLMDNGEPELHMLGPFAGQPVVFASYPAGSAHWDPYTLPLREGVELVKNSKKANEKWEADMASLEEG